MYQDLSVPIATNNLVPLRDRLENALKHEQNRINDMKKILLILDKNPDLENLLNLLSKINFQV